MKITVEDATLEHLAKSLDDIRPEDLREWYAGTGNPDFQHTAGSSMAPGCYAKVAVREDGFPLVFWGCNDMGGGRGNVWLFATETAVGCFLPIHRHLKPQLQALLDRWPLLEAWADCRNTVHHKWLEWLRFDYRGEQHLEPLGLPFKLYVKVKEAQSCA
jgi:hypothetical protein